MYYSVVSFFLIGGMTFYGVALISMVFKSLKKKDSDIFRLLNSFYYEYKTYRYW